ncbi:MAG: ABC transporter permease, partial [Alphaproteobacteria bacterium]
MKANKADYFGQKATMREDGRVMFDLALYEMKKPDESKYAWDYYKQVRVLKGEEAFLPLNKEICPFLRDAKK